MKFIFNFEETDEGTRLTDYEVKGDDGLSFDGLTSGIFCFLDRVTKGFLRDHPEAKDELYEHFSGIFDLFFRNVFPDPPEGYFELSDAALLYAQDKIIDEAEKKGLTFEEALNKYEKRAKEYLRQKKEGLS